jgi:hypothetical protein
MATIRQKGPEQWHAQVRRTDWPPVTETLRTRKDAETWARDGEASRAAEKSRLERFMRDEPKLCAYAVAHLRPEHFEEYRDRRLTQIVTRGKPGGRGQYKPDKVKPGRFRKDGTPRANAATKAPPNL